jgi:hypothetical protein
MDDDYLVIRCQEETVPRRGPSCNFNIPAYRRDSLLERPAMARGERLSPP